jgi:hypothetical protein
MPAAIPIAALVVAAAGTTYEAINANQQEQHAKGAAQAQATQEQNLVNQQTAADQSTQNQKANTGSATQQAAISALRASMSANSGFGGSILTSGQGTQGTQQTAPTATKTLLGA